MCALFKIFNNHTICVELKLSYSNCKELTDFCTFLCISQWKLWISFVGRCCENTLHALLWWRDYKWKQKYTQKSNTIVSNVNTKCKWNLNFHVSIIITISIEIILPPCAASCVLTIKGSAFVTFDWAILVSIDSKPRFQNKKIKRKLAQKLIIFNNYLHLLIESLFVGSGVKGLLAFLLERVCIVLSEPKILL